MFFDEGRLPFPWSVGVAFCLSGCGGPSVEVVEPPPGVEIPASWISGGGPDDLWMAFTEASTATFARFDGASWSAAAWDGPAAGFADMGGATLLVSDADGVYTVDGEGVEPLPTPDGVGFGAGGTTPEHALAADHGRPFLLAPVGPGGEPTSFVYEDGAWASSSAPDVEVLQVVQADDGSLLGFSDDGATTRVWSFDDGAWSEAAEPFPVSLSTLTLSGQAIFPSATEAWTLQWVDATADLGLEDESGFAITLGRYDGASWQQYEMTHTSKLGRAFRSPFLTTDAHGSPVIVVSVFDNRHGKGDLDLVGLPIRPDMTLGSELHMDDLRDFCGDFCLDLPPLVFSRLDDGTVVVGRHDMHWDLVGS